MAFGTGGRLAISSTRRLAEKQNRAVRRARLREKRAMPSDNDAIATGSGKINRSTSLMSAKSINSPC